jgi:hypothetical protein
MHDVVHTLAFGNIPNPAPRSKIARVLKKSDRTPICSTCRKINSENSMLILVRFANLPPYLTSIYECVVGLKTLFLKRPKACTVCLSCSLHGSSAKRLFQQQYQWPFKTPTSVGEHQEDATKSKCVCSQIHQHKHDLSLHHHLHDLSKC